jgi:hypothetical protein
VGLLVRLLAPWILRRLSRSRRADSRFAGRRGGRGYRYASPGRSRKRSGFGFFGPLPYYSTRTRGGSRVAVSGCCLPLALAPFALPALAVGLLRRRR